MKRREFIRNAGGATAVLTTGASTAAAQEGTGTATATGTGAATGTGTGNATGTGNGTGTGNATGTGNGTGTGNATGTGTGGGGGGGGGGTVTVAVGPNGDYTFVPGTDQPLYITPGTTVEFVWESDNHNIVVGNQPDGAGWEGHPPIQNEGFTYSHTFSTLGTYEYHCVPHEALGMVGIIEVVESTPTPGGAGEQELHELGVPIQAHWVGSATVLGVIMTIIFSFYVLKYGESPNTGTGRSR